MSNLKHVTFHGLVLNPPSEADARKQIIVATLASYCTVAFHSAEGVELAGVCEKDKVPSDARFCLGALLMASGVDPAEFLRSFLWKGTVLVLDVESAQLAYWEGWIVGEEWNEWRLGILQR